MRKDKAINVFLFFILFAMLFVYSCPVYFSFGEVHMRIVSLAERFFSLLFVLLWIALCSYTAWKKRLPLLAGGILFSLMAYLPGWILPHVSEAAGRSKDPSLFSSITKYMLERMYELINAPMAGVSLLVSSKASQNLGKQLLPALLLIYAGTQVFRFYRNAYLADQLHIEDTAYASNPELARELAVAPTPDTVETDNNLMAARQEIDTEGTIDGADAIEKQTDDSQSEGTERITSPEQQERPGSARAAQDLTDIAISDENGQTKLRFPQKGK
jgi:hypothetical protein